MECWRSISKVSSFDPPAVNSNGWVVFSSPEGTVKVTCVPLSIMPVAVLTTIRIWLYLPAGIAEDARSSETLVKDARSTDPFLIDTLLA